jgi:hypothetical protein
MNLRTCNIRSSGRTEEESSGYQPDHAGKGGPSWAGSENNVVPLSGLFSF